MKVNKLFRLLAYSSRIKLLILECYSSEKEVISRANKLADNNFDVYCLPPFELSGKYINPGDDMVKSFYNSFNDDDRAKLYKKEGVENE